MKRPTTNVHVFKAWSADSLAKLVCPLTKTEVAGSTIIPDNDCSKHNRNAIDPTTATPCSMGST